MENVGKYTSPMDGMEYRCFFVSFSKHILRFWLTEGSHGTEVGAEAKEDLEHVSVRQIRALWTLKMALDPSYSTLAMNHLFE